MVRIELHFLRFRGIQPVLHNSCPPFNLRGLVSKFSDCTYAAAPPYISCRFAFVKHDIIAAKVNVNTNKIPMQIAVSLPLIDPC